MEGPTFVYETERIAEEWHSGKLSPLLVEIVTWADQYAIDRWGWPFFLTCIYRTPEEDAGLEGHGVHPRWRAVDVRTRDQEPEAVTDVVDAVNARWTYDPARPQLVVCYAKPHGTGPHAHFQVHDATVATGVEA